ncbi:kelch-like protein 38 [Syngnathus scovelli]|uniref:kelch-like protein 38 n=1 Tax=Syngnathus scovelli TaxID=161590 RepID=UPI00210F6CE9|nr:kelch-like protein 38 [Syngnathus scovelli]
MERAATEAFHYKDKEQSSKVLRQLDSLRRERLLTDVWLCCGDTEIPCHRNVLVSSSPYFRAMFCNNFAERQQSRIRLRGLSPAILNAVVDYVYTGQAAISEENVLPLTQAASMLHLAALFEACCAFLQDGLSPDNCLSMMRLSEMMGCQSLGEKAKEVATKSFDRVSRSQDLRELSLPELVGYLEDDGLCAEEEQVFETLLAWIHHEPLSRHTAIGELFKKVRLGHVHPTYLFQFMASDPLIRSSALCVELIESVRRLMFCVSDNYLDHLQPRRRTYTDNLLVVGGRKNNEQSSREALMYVEKCQEWKHLAKLPIRLYKASYVALHGVAYVIGGLSTEAKSCRVRSSVYALSLKTNEWREAPPMLQPRFSHQSVSYLHFILVLGGLGSDRRLTDSVERYNSMFNQWESMAPMPEPVLHPAVAATNQRIYMFGGEDAMQNPVRLIQVYHIARNLWCKMENRTVKNVSAPAVVMDEKIYIVGGYTRRMLAYDTKANRLVKCANLNERRMHHSATLLHNKVYVTGGRYINSRDVVEDSDHLECYDPKTDAWTVKGTLPYKLFDHGSLTLASVLHGPSDSWLREPLTAQ